MEIETMDTNLRTGRQGAKVQSWRSSPRDLLKKLMDKSPGASKEKLFKTFYSYITSAKGEQYLQGVAEYWFANNFNSLVREEERPKRAYVRAQRKEELEVRTEEFKKIIKEKATKLVLLDLIQPNGKPLRDCKGSDCAKFGGWLSRIAKAIAPNEIVGEALSEEQVRHLRK